MKQIFLFFVTVGGLFVAGCSGGGTNGELVGVPQKRFAKGEVPYGMVYIPTGTFIMGPNDEDLTGSQLSQNKQITIQGFYMDETEITNSEYTQFVYWVRDSIAVTQLQDEQFYLKPKSQKGEGESTSSKKYINWKKVGDGRALWGPANAAKLQSLYYQGEDQIFDKNELDVRLLKYNFSMFKLREAANSRGDKTKKRSDFIVHDTVAIYPDTLVWLSDFSYAQNEPLVQGYFSHPAYAEYPVVGVTWRQARAFNAWRTKLNEAYQQSRNLAGRSQYSLPTEAEFEYAARGGRNGTIFPWGSPYLRNAKGCLLANFKPGRGNYIEDGGGFTVSVRSYYPNDYGLYCMAGNVAEWTASTFDESGSTFTHDFNPSYNYEGRSGDPEAMKRKVVRGGSWKDVGFFLQNASSTFEYQDTAKSYIGFRCISKYQGRDIRDKY